MKTKKLKLKENYRDTKMDNEYNYLLTTAKRLK